MTAGSRRRRRTKAARTLTATIAASIAFIAVATTVFAADHLNHEPGATGPRAASSALGSATAAAVGSANSSSGAFASVSGSVSAATSPFVGAATSSAGTSSGSSSAASAATRSTRTPESGGRTTAAPTPSARQTNGAGTPTVSVSPAVTQTATTSATLSSSASKSPAPGGVWRPAVGTTWQWQLSGSIDTSVAASVYDIDAESSAATVATLHSQGRRVICYVDVGSWEPGRADAGKFPASVRGKKMDGWDENWLDIRQLNVLGPLMAARFDTCKAKGFDAIEPDNVDGYSNDTGFALTSSDQLAYNRMIAQLAHQRGLGVGLKNDLDQTGALVSSFDFAVNEQCAEYDECSGLAPFVSAGKAVLHVEYNVAVSAFCGKYPGFSSMRKHLSLDAWRQPC